MKKISLVLVAVFAFIAFSPNHVEVNKTNHVNSLEIKKDILFFQDIIVKNQKEANILEIEATQLFKYNTKEAENKLEEAKMLKYVCLKYKAAIAIREMHLNNI